MNKNDLNINDFSESDFSDPISLLDALKRKKDAIFTINKLDGKQMLLLSDIEKNYGVSLAEILRAVQAGILEPVSVIPIFSKEDIINFCATNSSSNPLFDSFEKELHSMNMSYSYKPILLLAMLKNNLINKAVAIDNIIDYYLEYYDERLTKSLVVEKQNSTFVKHPNDRQIARRTILTYPVKVLCNKNFIVFDKNTDSISFNKLLYADFDEQYLDKIETQCKLRLNQYYSSLLSE